MKKNKIVNILMWLASIVCLVLCPLTIVFGLNSEKSYAKIVLIVVGVLFLILAAMIGYLAYTDRDKVSPKRSTPKRPENYFLNVNGKRKGIEVDDLTFEIVDKQMNKYIMDTFGSPIALWQNGVFSMDESTFGKEGAFKILIAYKMLSDLQTHHSKKLWKLFFELSDVDFTDLKEQLLRNGDDELAQALVAYKNAGPSTTEDAAAFLDENESYIKRRMLNYVTRKIDCFDI